MKTLQTIITNCQISIGLDIVIGALSLVNGFIYVLVETSIEEISKVTMLCLIMGILL